MNSETVITVDKLDPEMLNKFIRNSQPVVSKGELNHWKAMDHWDFNWFREHYGDTVVPVSDGRSRKLLDLPLSSYLDFAQSVNLENICVNLGATPYLQDWVGYSAHPELLEYTPFHGWIRNWEVYYARLLKMFYQEASIFIGPAGACTYLHQDRDYTHAWLSQIRGHKRWILFSPEQTPLLTRPLPGSSIVETVNIYKPDPEKFPNYHKAVPLEIDVGPGDTIFVPGGWWHQVLSLEPTISVSGSYWNSSNAWRFFKSRVKDRSKTFLARLKPGPWELLKHRYTELARTLPDCRIQAEDGHTVVLTWNEGERQIDMAGTSNLLEITISNWHHQCPYISFVADQKTYPISGADWNAVRALLALSPVSRLKLIIGFSALRLQLYGLISKDLQGVYQQALKALEQLVENFRPFTDQEPGQPLETNLISNGALSND